MKSGLPLWLEKLEKLENTLFFPKKLEKLENDMLFPILELEKLDFFLLT